MPHSRLVPQFTITAERLEQMKEVVPEAFADGKVNWEALRESLGDTLEPDEAGAEHFGLLWPGKREARRLAALPSRAALMPAPGEGLNEDQTKNVFIEGENLEVLRLLQRAYGGRVRMIYIDPPYNTGNDFIYDDDFADPLGDYLRKTGQADRQGHPLTTNTRADGRFHSNWLSMMYPRLRLARNLLREDGVLVVSCNDIEQAHLKMVLSELFGEENFIATMVWNNEGNIDNQSKIKCNHEYLHVYARSADRFERPSVIDLNIEESSKLYRDEIQNSITKNGPANPPSRVLLPVGFPATFDQGRIEKRVTPWPKIHQDIVVKRSEVMKPAEVESGWSSRNLLQLFIDNGCVPIRDAEGKETRFAVTQTGAIYGYKRRSSEQGHVLTVIRNVGTTKQNSGMLERWGLAFDWPKPVLLIRYLCEVFTGKNDLVLDFFAGSCTTAQAVYDINQRDKGDRRFIMVQMPEPAKDGTSSTVADIGKARILAAAKELRKSRGKDAWGDLGFKVFKLAGSHFRAWKDFTGQDVEELQSLFAQTPLADTWTVDGLLAEIMLLEGFPLDSSIGVVPGVKGNALIAVAQASSHRLLCCFDGSLNEAVVNEFKFAATDVFVCLDSALTDEQKVGLADRCTIKTI